MMTSMSYASKILDSALTTCACRSTNIVRVWLRTLQKRTQAQYQAAKVSWSKWLTKRLRRGKWCQQHSQILAQSSPIVVQKCRETWRRFSCRRMRNIYLVKPRPSVSGRLIVGEAPKRTECLHGTENQSLNSHCSYDWLTLSKNLLFILFTLKLSFS